MGIPGTRLVPVGPFGYTERDAHFRICNCRLTGIQGVEMLLSHNDLQSSSHRDDGIKFPVAFELEADNASSDSITMQYHDEVVGRGITLRTLQVAGSSEVRFRAAADGVGVAYVHSGQYQSDVGGMATEPTQRNQLRLFFNGAVSKVNVVKDAGALDCTMILVGPDRLLSMCASDISLLPDQLLAILQGNRRDRYFSYVSGAQCVAMIAEQIRNCPYEGVVRRLFLEAKAKEFLAVAFHALKADAGELEQTPSLRSDEAVSLEEAKRIIENEYRDPPSLPALSRRVGLNDFKLKRGFRLLYKTTVYSMINELRMEEARRLLRETDLRIAQIGYRVGFASGTAFSRAFNRMYGCTPKALRKSERVPCERQSD